MCGGLYSYGRVRRTGELLWCEDGKKRRKRESAPPRLICTLEKLLPALEVTLLQPPVVCPCIVPAWPGNGMLGRGALAAGSGARAPGVDSSISPMGTKWPPLSPRSRLRLVVDILGRALHSLVGRPAPPQRIAPTSGVSQPNTSPSAQPLSLAVKLSRCWSPPSSPFWAPRRLGARRDHGHAFAR